MAPPTTYRTFIDGLEALSISGVVKTYTQGPPASLSAANLPAQWVDLPTGEDAPLQVSGAQWPTLRADLVVAYAPTSSGDRGTLFDATVDMMDAVQTALRAFDVGKTKPRWSIGLEIAAVAKIEYWAVVASVEVEG